MTQLALSIKQMKHLEELGLNTSDAYLAYDSTGYLTDKITAQNGGEIISAYTLQDILERLDDELTRNSCGESEYYTVETFLGVVELNDKKQNLVKLFGENNILNNAYNMLVWCIENGYINTNKA